jgi:hypothetical protein
MKFGTGTCEKIDSRGNSGRELGTCGAFSDRLPLLVMYSDLGDLAGTLHVGFTCGVFDSAARRTFLLSTYSAVFNFNLLLLASKNSRNSPATSSNRIHCS